MAFKDRIKEARLSNKFTQEQLAEKIGVAKSTLAGYETGNREPNLETTIKLMSALNVDANYLWQDEISFPVKVSYEEMEHIKKYRFISNHSPSGSKAIDFLIDHEYTVAQQLYEKDKRITELESNPVVVEKREGAILRMYSYIHKIACAGNGFYFDDIPTDTIEAPYKEGADFIAGVNGDSMEPTFKDGDLVYVERRQIIDIGDIGLFILNNECYIKEAGEEGLISHNPEYDIIPGTDQIQCIGKVLGKVNA